MTEDLLCTIIPYFQVEEGKLGTFKEIIREMVEQTKTEPLCHYYSFYFDGNSAFCREAYEGADGVLTHIHKIGPLLEQAIGIAEMTFLEIHGPADELAKLKEPLAELSPRYFELECGFRK